jgi:hypothetical protein
MSKYQITVTNEGKEFSFEMVSPNEPTITEALSYFMESPISEGIVSDGSVHGVTWKSTVLL